jgi:thioredoxin reductase (NADPH)
VAATENGERRRRPAILAVDDEPAVLAAVARDLRRQFGEGYRILRAGSGRRGSTSCATSSRAATRSRCWWPISGCPGLSGTDFLVQARQIVPGAKRVLLTAYADTEAAIQAINEVALDYYLLKPWDPPEELLFPVVEDLLTTWDGGRRARVGRRAA